MAVEKSYVGAFVEAQETLRLRHSFVEHPQPSVCQNTHDTHVFGIIVKGFNFVKHFVELPKLIQAIDF